MVNRFDFFKVSAPKKDSNGFLKVDSTPTRSGVFEYMEVNEIGKIELVKELRHPDDVFSRETLDSLKGVPYITQENHVMIYDPTTIKNKARGMTMEDVERIDNLARVSIKILNAEEIDAIEGNESLELSAGHRCDVIAESGHFDGVEYNKRQKNILYNHVARVENARGGETCRIRLDSKSAINGIEADRIDSDKVSDKPNGESIMTITLVKRKIPAVKIKEFRLDADPVEIPADYEGVIDRVESRQETLVSVIEEREERIDSLTKEATANQAKIDVLTGENKDLKEANENSIPVDKLDSAVRERAKYLSYAKDYKLDGADEMANDDILKGIVIASKKVKDETKLDDMTYTKAVFDMLDHEHEKKKIASKDNLDNHSIDPKKEGSEFDQARKRRNG